MDYTPFYYKNFKHDDDDDTQSCEDDFDTINEHTVPYERDNQSKITEKNENQPNCDYNLYHNETDYTINTDITTKNQKKSSKGKVFIVFIILICFGLVCVFADIISGGKITTTLQATFTTQDTDRTYYFVAKGNYQTINQTKEDANTIIQKGGAGYIYRYEGHYTTIITLFESKEDAEKVIQKNSDFYLITINIDGKTPSSLKKEQKDIYTTIIGSIYDTITELISITENIYNGKTKINEAKKTIEALNNEVNTKNKELLDSSIDDEYKYNLYNVTATLTGGMDNLIINQIDDTYIQSLRYVVIGSIISMQSL